MKNYVSIDLRKPKKCGCCGLNHMSNEKAVVWPEFESFMFLCDCNSTLMVNMDDVMCVFFLNEVEAI